MYFLFKAQYKIQLHVLSFNTFEPQFNQKLN